METRRAGPAGLQLPVLAFGTATFGGGNEFFRKWGTTDVADARRMIDICLDSGIDFFDTANVYSQGAAESILGEALGTRRSQVLIATKIGYRTHEGADGAGGGRRHLTLACEQSLRRLKRDWIDILQLHGYDEFTPVEETLRALDDLVAAGKVRNVGASNFSGWQLARTNCTAARLGIPGLATHQVQYSLLHRDFEHELMPAGHDLGIATIVWSPLAGGKLSGKIRRDRPIPADSRTAKMGGLLDEGERLHAIVDVLDAIGRERDRSISQVALNWLLSRPTIACLAIGARTPGQLQENLGATEWTLTAEEIARLDAASATPAPYPYAHQRMFPYLTRKLV